MGFLARSRFVGLARMLTAAVVLATAAYLHHTRFLRVRAVLTAILTALFTRTIACGMLTFILFLVFCHVNTPCSTNSVVNDTIPDKKLRHRTHNDSSRPLAEIQDHRSVQLNRMLFAINADDEICRTDHRFQGGGTRRNPRK